ncbi:MAG: hypothetical protein C4582_06345 [Desulfobacteraceae bacterium]|jgi:type IV pilus assembly protein PilX|nr:MAG: hypothetical protein C4582_06345 [Desulfobacteraceae bacterium]
MGKKTIRKNQNGSVLVLGMMMLVLLSLLGIAVVTTSTIEVQIAANDRLYKENLYDSEAATMEGAQTLQNADLKNAPPAWLMGIGAINEANDMFSDVFWNNTVQSANVPEARLAAAFQGYAPGSSLDLGRSRVHLYSIYGRCQRNNGAAIVRVGYRKAF